MSVLTEFIRKKLLVWLLLMVPFLAISAENKLPQQRLKFSAAEQAFAAGRLSEYRRLAGGLTDYPLYPYLRYQRLRKNLAPAKYAEVEKFLSEYGDLPIADRLREKWLMQLARRQQWRHFVSAYQPMSSVKLQCHYFRSRLELGDQPAAWRGAEKLWLHGRSQPKACDRLFSRWRQSSDFSADLVWQRLQLSLDRGNTSLARYLVTLLPPADQLLANRLIQVHRQPESVASCDLWQQPELAGVAAHGIRRLARRDPAQASQLWQSRQPHLQLDQTDRLKTLSRLGLELTLDGTATAGAFLDSLPPAALDDTLAQWRMRWALGQGDWGQLLRWYVQLDEEPRNSSRWRYWQSQALQATGRQTESDELLNTLAGERDYYGFLAADQLNLPYGFQQQPIEASAGQLASLTALPAVARVIELRHFGRQTDARREWRDYINNQPAAGKALAAKLAQQWQWHHMAVLTAAAAKSWHDLDLRFPVVYEELIAKQSAVQQLPPELVLGLVRRESLFDPEARSGVGARGLMQLMPATARKVARHRQERRFSTGKLYQPDLNLRYGTHYLRQLIDQYQGDKVLALAAYNGGPNNVKRWLKSRPTGAAALWVEMITYGETREYVQAVLSYAIIYRQLAGESPVRLAKLARSINQPGVVPATVSEPVRAVAVDPCGFVASQVAVN